MGFGAGAASVVPTGDAFGSQMGVLVVTGMYLPIPFQ